MAINVCISEIAPSLLETDTTGVDIQVADRLLLRVRQHHFILVGCIFVLIHASDNIGTSTTNPQAAHLCPILSTG